jgi:hypothetical protein
MKEECFILKNLKTNKFIGIDSNSGGYPYDCNLNQCQRFDKIETAKKYRNTFKNENWRIYALRIEFNLSGVEQ